PRPAVKKVGAAAARIQCGNNLKQIGLAIHNFHDVNGAFPAGNVYKPNAQGQFNYYDTWAISILPFIEQDNLFKLWDPTLPNAVADSVSPNMAKLRQTAVKVYNCPADTGQFTTPLTPNSAPGGQTGLLRWLYMPSTYRGVAGTTFGGRSGVDQTGGDANWDDATQVQWLMGWRPGFRGPLHACHSTQGGTPERITDI